VGKIIIDKLRLVLNGIENTKEFPMFKYSLLAVALIFVAVACNKKEEAAPVEAAPVEAAPVEAAPVEEAAPAEAAPAEAAPEAAPAQ
jgi:hypothetical protein